MKIIAESNENYILRFDAGEEVMAGIASFCKERGVSAGYFSMIGSCQGLTFLYYNLKEKRYEDHSVNEDLEIVNVTGNVGLLNGETIVHAHGVFGRRSLETIGGHIKKLVISATGEAAFSKLHGAVNRAYDDATGLNLMR